MTLEKWLFLHRKFICRYSSLLFYITLMGPLEILAVVVFLSTYVFITFETKFNISKASAAMLAGGLCWVIVALAKPHEVKESIEHAGAEIFPVVLFFLTSLTLVEILVHYRFFDMLRAKIYAMNLDDKKQFVIMCLISFFLSAFIDSSAVVLVMVTFATRFFTRENMVKAAVAIITSGNVGGSFSPVGDLTTVLLWLAGKFDATTVISQAFLPNLAMATVVISIMYFSIKPRAGDDDKTDLVVAPLAKKEKVISAMVFGTFLLPFAIKPLGLPPYIALLLGLASIWLMIDHLKSRQSHNDSLLAGSIDRLINKIDLPTIKFYVGILLGINALSVLGVLQKLSVLIYGADPTFWTVIIGHIGLGLATTIVDNVSITSFVIDTLNVTDPNLWTLFAITIGTGGSLSLFGSGAGILAATVVKDLTFVKYLRYGFLPILLGYATAVTVWFIQYNIFFK